MKNLYKSQTSTSRICFTAILLLLLSGSMSAATTVTFTNATSVAIPDDTYNGTLGTMASTSVVVSGIPAGAIIRDIKVVASLNHTWVGDLVIKLRSPNLTVLGLVSRPGLSEASDNGTGGAGLADNLVAGFPITISDTGIYDAEVMGGIGDANNICQNDGQCSFILNPGAIATPPSLFSDLYGGIVNGTWTFYAGDAGFDDLGNIASWTLEVTYDVAPANDDCSDAISIGCLSASVAGSTLGATVDAIFTDCGAGGDNTTEQGVWYVFPGSNNQVTMTTCDASGTGYDTRLTIYSGSCGAFTCVTANDDMSPDCATGDFRSSVTFNAFSGTNYYVFVHGFQVGTALSETGDFILNLSCGPLCTPVPANDVCASSQALTLGIAASGSTVCSNSTPGLVNPLCATGFVTLYDTWYTVTTGAGSAYNITLTETTSTNTVFTIYSGTCGSLTEISGFCGTAGTYPFALSPSTTYYIRVFNEAIADEGTYSIGVSSFVPEANDECNSVIPAVIVNGAAAVTFTGSTVNASASADEIFYLGYAAVWEAVTLTGVCNHLTVDFCGTAAGIMAQPFSVYTDCPITGTTSGSTDFSICGDGNLTVTYIGLPAGTYYLPVISDPVFNTLGTYTMNVSSIDCGPPPVNDNCLAALPILCADTVTGSTFDATLDGPATSCTGGSVASDVWYTYLGTGQDFTASLCAGGTDYDSKLDIYTGTCGALVSIDCNDDFCGAQSEVAITPSSLGTVYFIRVHGFNGNVGNYELSISDNPPTITCPGTVNVNTDAGTCTASGVNLGSPTSGDDCGVATVTNDAPSTYPVGNTTVTWTATDLSGQSSTCTQTVTVTDNEDPIISCPSNIAVNTAPGLCVSATINLGTATATDNCGVFSVTSNASSSTYPVGVTAITWTATDVNGNTATCIQTVTVTDNQLPAITCPAAVNVSADSGSCVATNVVIGTPVTADNCGVDTVSNNAPSTFPMGNTTITWTLRDVNGNTATCTQSVTVTDNELPVITCPAAVSVSADSGTCSATGVVIGTATATDNCPGTVVTNNAPSSFPVGITTVTWTATDAVGNVATCTQTVTVTDDELPVITCNAAITVNTPNGTCGVAGSSLTAPTASDNCGVASVTSNAPVTLTVGTTTVTWTATDVNGNTATCTQTVTVVDNQLPTITCPTTVSVSTDTGSCVATNVALGTPVTADNCGVDSVFNNAPASFPSGNTTVTWTVIDVNGNAATCTQTVTVTEDELPVITCPAAVNVSADAGACNATGVALGTATATDNCVGITITNNAASSFPVGTTTVTWTATDAAGNTATCTQTVTVMDNELPVSTCSASITVNTPSGTCGVAGSSLNAASATDNCGVASVTSNAPVTLPVGTTTVTWTATDVNGNTSTCTQTVTVIDNELPTIICPATVNAGADAGSCFATNVVLGTPITADNCGVDSVSNNAPSSFPTGSTTVTWTVTDVNGNTATCTQTVVVTDNVLPTITCPAAVSVTADSGACNATGVALGTPIAADNCGSVTVANNAPSTFPLGSTTVTWTATDAGGNTSACTQTVTVTDDELPVITCSPSITVNTASGSCGITGSSLTAPTTTDNCGVASVTSDAPVTLPVGSTTVTWTATDVNGNAATCTQTVTVTDNELPTISCPATVNAGADAGSCFATNVALGTPVTDDNCGVDSVSNDAPSSFPTGSTTVTWTVTDVNGNTATCTQTVLVTDNVLPTITCPAAVSVTADSSACNATGVVLGTPTATDNCPGTTVTNNAPSSFPVGSTTVTWTATDAGGNTATCTQTVTVTDDELPAITCNAAITVNTASGSCGVTGSTLTAPTTTDNCGVASVTSDAPVTLPIGTTTVTWTATDVNGNTATCTQTVTVVDNELPTITCPATVNVSADAGSCFATNVALGTPVTADNCGVDSVSNNAPSSFPTGSTTVTWTVTDVNGNTATCIQTVFVTDNVLPTITCPAAVSVTADSAACNASGVILGTPIAADNCGSVTVTNNAPSSFPVGSTTVTWTATDAGGNTATCTQTVTVTDNELPVITCNAAISVNTASGTCGIPGATLTAPTTTDNCGVASVTSDAPVTLPIGTTTVTWTATDVNGNTATCTQTVTVMDNELPTITCPATVNVGADAGSCFATNVALGTPVTADNCGVDSVSNNAPSSFPTGSTTVTWTVTDVNGNTATCIQTVFVTDNVLPTITCPAAVSVTADSGACNATGVILGTPTAADNCGSVTVTNNAPSSFPVGSTTVTWTATDAGGNTATCTQIVTVTDDELPVITCNAAITVNTSIGVCGIPGSSVTAPATADNCAIAGVTSDAPVTLPVGNTTVTWTATDVNGNTATCTQTVTVIDNELPTITCPATVNVGADAGSCFATNVALGTPITADNCGVDTVSNNAPSSFPTGSTTVTWTVTDVNGNTATCTQTVFVTDNVLPTITCPAAANVTADAGVCNAAGVVLGTPTAADNCGSVTLTNNAPSSFPVGSTTVTWTATDAGGNTATCTQTVTVTDQELPVVTCNAAITVNTTSGVCGVTGSSLTAPAATDNCAVASVTSNAPATLPIGTTTVTWTATDVNGNTATCTQAITVTDNELPTITCPTTVNVSTDAGSCVATNVVLGTPVTSDNCTVDSVSNDAPASFPLGNTTVTWTVTDVNGNTASCTQTVTVTDNVLPTITCPAPVNVTADAGTCSANGVVLGTPTAADNCGVDSIANDAPSSFPAGNTTVTWTVTDVNGNTSTCTQTVTVTENEAPVITCNAAITLNTASGVCGVPGASLTAPTATDNCTIASVTSDAPVTLPIGTTTVTWTATDVNGNTASCTQTITVIDNELPTVTCQATVSVNTDTGSCDATVALPAPVVSDNCAVATTVNDAPTSFPIGNTIVTWTVTDVNGNTASCTQTVTVTDNVLPIITCPSSVNVSADSGSCVATNVVVGTPVATDNCSVDSISNDAPSTFPLGNTTVTWTVTDVNGNTATCTQTITVTDNELPTITCPGAVNVSTDAGLCSATVALGTPTVTDNCTGTTITNNAPSSFPVGSTTVTWTVTDAGGNSATCSQTVRVTDNENPVITCPAGVNANTNATPCVANNVVLGLPSASDNCSIATTTNNAPASFQVGATTVVWTTTDVNGNTATCSQVVTVTSSLDTSVTLTGPTFTANAAGASFQWFNCTTQSNISGQTNATFTPTASGLYAVIVTQNGCTDTSACFNFIFISVSEPLSGNGIKVYPNPATDQLQIEVTGLINGIAHLQLIDINGKVVRDVASENMTGVQTISLTDLASDIYVLRITTASGVWNAKVMKVD